MKVKGALLVDSPRLRILNIYSSESLAKAVIETDIPRYHLRTVEYLNLMNNNLKLLQPTFPQYLPNLKRIQLSSNPWACSRLVLDTGSLGQSCKKVFQFDLMTTVTAFDCLISLSILSSRYLCLCIRTVSFVSCFDEFES